MDALVREHWEEVSLDQGKIPLAPDYDGFQRMEDQGLLRTMAARRDGLLVGYNAFMVMPHLHYRHTLHALNDAIFVHPDERGSAGVRLILESERALFEIGVVKIFYHAKLHVAVGARRSGTVGDILERLGYRHVENIYAKVRTD